MYQTASEVVREGLRVLKQRDDERPESLRRDILSGIASLNRGDYQEYDEQSLRALAEDVKARWRARVSEKGKLG